MESADKAEDPVRTPQADFSRQPLRGAFHILGVGAEVRSIDSGYVTVANDVKRLPGDGKSFEVTPYAFALWNDARGAKGRQPIGPLQQCSLHPGVDGEDQAREGLDPDRYAAKRGGCHRH